MYDNADKLVMEKMGIIEALDKSIVVDRQELIDNNRQVRNQLNFKWRIEICFQYFEGIADDELMITGTLLSINIQTLQNSGLLLYVQ